MDVRLAFEIIASLGLVGALGSYLKLRAELRDNERQRSTDMQRVAYDAVQNILNEREGDVKVLREEIDTLRTRVARLEDQLAAAQRMEGRLLGLLRRVLQALQDHDADAAGRIRRDNPDLDL